MEMRFTFLDSERMNEHNRFSTESEMTTNPHQDLYQGSEHEKGTETTDSALTPEKRRIELEEKLIRLLASPHNPFRRRIWRLVTAFTRSEVEANLRARKKKERESVSESKVEANRETRTVEKGVEIKLILVTREVLIPILKLLLSREYRSNLQEYSTKYEELLQLEAGTETEDSSDR